MEEHVYSGSAFWWAANVVNEITYLLYPLLLMAAAIVWAVRSRSILSYLSLFGATLCLGANITHRVVGKVTSVGLGYPVAEIHQNVFVWFVFRQGIGLGLFLFGLALVLYFIKHKGTKNYP